MCRFSFVLTLVWLVQQTSQNGQISMLNCCLPWCAHAICLVLWAHNGTCSRLRIEGDISLKQKPKQTNSWQVEIGTVSQFFWIRRYVFSKRLNLWDALLSKWQSNFSLNRQTFSLSGLSKGGMSKAIWKQLFWHFNRFRKIFS